MGFFHVLSNLSEGAGRFRVVGGVLQFLERARSEQNLVGFRRVATHFCVGLVAGDPGQRPGSFFVADDWGGSGWLALGLGDEALHPAG